MIDVIELAKPDPTKTNVVGIVRVSVDRDGMSPEEQRERIQQGCERDGKNLIRIHRELDVSGTRALSRRPGLRAAVEAVEAREAQEIHGAYFDRLFRSLKTQAEAIERVETADGKLLALDFGQISDATVAQWVTSSTVGMMAEYHARSTRERTEPTRVRMVGAGQLPWPKPPFGILLNDDRTVRIDEDKRELVAQIFAMRAAGESKTGLKRFLAERGFEMTIRAIEAILGQPLYMGELHFGKRVNRRPFGDVEPIVDKRTFDAVQAMKSPRGRQAPSERLLARLGVLYCAHCGARMVAGGAWVSWTNKDGSTKRTRYAFYKCGMFQECAAPASISAENVEALVSERTREILADAEVRESGLAEAAQARREATAAVETYKRARRRLAVDGEIGDDEAAEILTELERDRDAKLALADALEHETDLVEAVNAARDWDVVEDDGTARISISAKRALIRLAIERVEVERGRVPARNRCTIKPRRKESARLAA